MNGTADDRKAAFRKAAFRAAQEKARGDTPQSQGLAAQDKPANSANLGVFRQMNEPPPGFGGPRPPPDVLRFDTPRAERPVDVNRELANMAAGSVGQFGASLLNAVPETAQAGLRAQATLDAQLGRVPGIGGLFRAKAAAGEAAAGAIPTIPPVEGMEDSLAAHVGGGVGRIGLAVAAPGVLGLSGAAALLPGAAMAGAEQGVANYHTAKAEGAGEDAAFGAFLGGAGIGAAGAALPVHRVLTRINAASGGGLAAALQDAVVFGGIAAPSAALNEVLLEHATDKDREVLDAAVKAGTTGALTGLIVSGLGQAVGVARKPQDATRRETAREARTTEIVQERAAQEAVTQETSLAEPTNKGSGANLEQEPAPVTDRISATTERVLGEGEAKPTEGRTAFEDLKREGQAIADEVEILRAVKAQQKAVNSEGAQIFHAKEGWTGTVEVPATSPPRTRANPYPEKMVGVRSTFGGAFSEPALRFYPESALEPVFGSGLKRPPERPAKLEQTHEERFAEWQRTHSRPAASPEVPAETAKGEGVSEAAPIFTREQIGVEKPQTSRRKRANGTDGETKVRIRAPFAETQARWSEIADTSKLEAEVSARIDFETGRVAKKSDPVWFVRDRGGEIIGRELTYPEAIERAKDFVEASSTPAPLSLDAPDLPPKPPGSALGALNIAGEIGGRPPVGGQPKEVLPDEGGFYPSRENWRETAIRKVADRFNTLRRVEQEAPVKGSDFSGAEVRMHGRAAVAQRALERVQDRAVEMMKRAGISAEEVGEYATARHAAKRDEVIAARSEGKIEHGSGMDPKRAAEILANKKPGMDAVMRVHDQVRDKALDFAVESGLISAETRKAWVDTYGDTFASLKTIAGDEPMRAPGAGKSLQVRGPESKRAEGRETEATNPFVSMFQNAQGIILRGEKNIVAQEFGKLVENNPGKWAEFVEPQGGHAPSGEDIFTYKVNGEPRYIRVHDKGTLRAVKSLDPVVAGTLMRAAGAAGRAYSQLHTSKNADFLGSNLSRDIGTAVGNISAEESATRAAKVVKSIPRSIAEIGRAIHAPEKATGHAKEYLEHGALTDWVEPLNDIKRLRSIEKRLSETPLREKLRAGVRAIEAVSGAVENGTRFAYFKALREAGVSADVAAVKAKELTVNWSKKGEWGQVMNALYLFSSASANGSLRFARAWSKPSRAIRVAGALTAAGVLVGIYNRTYGGKDDKDGRPWWSKQPESIKQRNLMIQHDDGEATKIPTAYGWGFFPYLGDKLAGAAYGEAVDPGEIMGAFITQFSPIEGGTFAQTITPWFFDPLVSVETNKDYAGRPIYTDRDQREKLPYASLPKEQKRASEAAQAVSRTLNAATGGNEARRGRLDVPPQALDYITGEAGGGAGRFMQRIYRTAEAALEGKAPLWRDVPVLNRFRSDKPQGYLREFYDILGEIDTEVTAGKGGQEYDKRKAAFKTAASRVAQSVSELRRAGRDDDADTLAARFIRLWDERTSSKAGTGGTR